MIMLQIGQVAPEFALPNQDGTTIRLSDLRGQKVILFAFPKAGTPGCNSQACEFRDEFPAISASNARVFGVSADEQIDLQSWKDAKKLPYELLSDTEHTMLSAYGAWGISVLGLIRVPVINRSYWVIDENGVLIDMQLNVGPKQSVEKALKAVQGVTAGR